MDINSKRWQIQNNRLSKGRQTNYDFNLCGSRLEIVNEYKYLGLLFNRSGSFYKNKSFIASQATKASFSLLKNVKS